MAPSFIFVFFLSALLQASFSLPITLKVKTVLLSYSVRESEQTEKTPVFDSEPTLKLDEETKLRHSLSTETVLKAFENFEAAHGNRIKRQVVRGGTLCPDELVEYRGHCITQQEYDEYNEISEGSDSDYDR